MVAAVREVVEEVRFRIRSVLGQGEGVTQRKASGASKERGRAARGRAARLDDPRALGSEACRPVSRRQMFTTPLPSPVTKRVPSFEKQDEFT